MVATCKETEFNYTKISEILLIECYFFLIADQSSIEVILNNRALLLNIANLLEHDSGTSLQELALQSGITEQSQLASVEPSVRFFCNLASNRGHTTLADLKEFIEVDSTLKNKSIFIPIGEAIDERRVDFTLKSTLAELKNSGKNWLYFRKNVAYKLLENTSQLPSWKDVAGRYKYDYYIIESFSKNVNEERPTVRLFQQLVRMEDILTISTLIRNLREIRRNDVVRLIRKEFNLANE